MFVEVASVATGTNQLLSHADLELQNCDCRGRDSNHPTYHGHLALPIDNRVFYLGEVNIYIIYGGRV